MKSVPTITLILTTLFSSAQSFEGVLVYKTSFDYHPSEKMMKMGITKELLEKKMKEDDSWSDSVKTIYKGGNYITIRTLTGQHIQYTARLTINFIHFPMAQSLRCVW